MEQRVRLLPELSEAPRGYLALVFTNLETMPHPAVSQLVSDSTPGEVLELYTPSRQIRTLASFSDFAEFHKLAKTVKEGQTVVFHGSAWTHDPMELRRCREFMILHKARAIVFVGYVRGAVGASTCERDIITLLMDYLVERTTPITGYRESSEKTKLRPLVFGGQRHYHLKQQADVCAVEYHEDTKLFTALLKVRGAETVSDQFMVQSID